MKPVGCCSELYRGNPSTSFAGPPPLSGEAYLANAVKIKVTRLHQKTLEYQHYRYRQGQLAALASPRRTARYERIPPDGFDTAALEVTLHGGTPPPPNGGPPPLSGEAIYKLVNAVKIKLDNLHKKTPEYQHYQYRQGQLSALASPRRTARETSEFRRTVSV